ncbi:ParB N-terminal domain-containing protein [Pseudomonas saudimassiliensis]|nr:ParB N-terminal domain-containing protein [Pseudomonas saudimassiliensis]
MSYEERHIALDDLLLDPNNFRYQESDDFVYADEARFGESQVQAKAYARLKQSEGLKALKSSIGSNTYIPSERIVVRKYSSDPDKFLVIEGNRRTAAAKWIKEDHAAGAPVSDEVLASISELPCVVVNADQDAQVVHASLMGIRHVSGIKQWGGYQRAKLVVTMRDDLELGANEVAERLGMSTHEVNRRYRAFKALHQFQQDEEYGEHFKPSLYPVFHEAVSLSSVKDWLGWDEQQGQFVNEDELHKFYSLISPSRIEEGDGEVSDVPPKINSYGQVRELRVILPNPDAFDSLINHHESSIDEAIAIAKQPEMARHWIRNVSAAKRALEDMSIRIIKEISDGDIAELESLKNLIDERLNDIQELRDR